MNVNTENKSKLLVVDDSEIDRAIIAEIFKNDFDVIEAKNGYEAIGYLVENPDEVSVVILDIYMPKMNGVEVLKKIRQIKELEQIPIVLITADALPETLKMGYANGMADFVVKPIDRYATHQRILNLAELYERKKADIMKENLQNSSVGTDKTKFNIDIIKDYNRKTLNTVIGMYENRNIETLSHIKRVEKFTKSILENMVNMHYVTEFKSFDLTQENIQVIAEATQYHDIGLLSMPDSILRSSEDELTDEEINLLKTHPKCGTAILRFNDNPQISNYINLCCDIALYHHERIDGGGYPFGKDKNGIPMEAQVAGLAIALDEAVCARIKESKDNYFENSIKDLILGKFGRFDAVLLNGLRNLETTVSEVIRLYPE